jgi:hypothetical protein
MVSRPLTNCVRLTRCGPNTPCVCSGSDGAEQILLSDETSAIWSLMRSPFYQWWVRRHRESMSPAEPQRPQTRMTLALLRTA